jgi:two-component system response regulator AtoC
LVDGAELDTTVELKCWQPDASVETSDFGDEYEREYAPLLGHSEAMRTLRGHIERVADTDATVLIRGESGVGKDIVAKAIHWASLRRKNPFVKVNCAALPSDLLESELFGHEKGAFTGAHRRKPGKFEVADGGTIFLDEIGELPIGLQAKLLQVLQDHDFTRVGGCDTIRVDVRVIAATNRMLETAVRTGGFREDLYYRLKVISLTVPPLRERREEIRILALLFVDRFNQQYGRRVGLDERVLAAMLDYPWPGNVRELENMVKLAVVLQDTAPILDELRQAHDPPAEAGPAAPLTAGAPRPAAEPAARPSLHEVARRAAIEAQRQAIFEVLEEVHWNRTEAARLLRVSYKALLYKMDQCGLTRKRHTRGG